MKKITILTPVLNEQDNLARYEAEVTRCFFSSKDYDFNVLFVDDGSTDSSWKIIRELSKKNPRFQGLRLSRNVGSHAAICAGFENVDADAVAILACDLQDPPEVIHEFIAEWNRGSRIVWGKRRTRDDVAWRVAASRMFFWLVSRFAMPKNSKFATGGFMLADREAVNAYRRFPERNRITFAIFAWMGFDQGVVEYDRKRRMAGTSGWSFGKMIKSMYDTFIGFSDAPIRVLTWTGMIISILNVIFSIYLVASWMIHKPLSGWTSLMLVISFFFGIHFLMLGLLGEYLRRIYFESVKRPLYIIADQTSDSQSGSPGRSRNHADADSHRDARAPQ